MILFTFFAFFLSAKDLTSYEFNQLLKSSPSVHVMFYAPWCGHCKHFKPIFDDVSDEVDTEGMNTKLVKVDCTVEQDLCQNHGITGYPSIKYFRDGKHVDDYQGERSFEAYYDYVSDLSKPPTTSVTNTEDFKEIMADNRSVKLFGFFCKTDDLLTEFRSAAESAIRKVVDFYYTTNEEVCAEGSQDGSPVVMYKPEENGIPYYGGPLSNWIRDSFLGPCGFISPKTKDLFTKPTLIAFFSVDYVNNRKYTEYYQKRMVKVMEQNDYSGKFMCGHSDIQSGADNLGIGKTEKIAVFMFAEDGKKYKMEREFSVDSVSRFADEYLAGNLKPTIKSSPIPESNQVEGLQEVVGLTFEEVVNQDKDVFMLFYAPWCGHCKSVMPVYEELAKHFSGDESVVIARMDASSNEHPPNYEVSGFPTFYYSPRGDKLNPVKYQGGRDLESFVVFLKQQTGSGNADL